MGSDCTGNPQLCNASVVVLNYCDGNSFAGARVGTVEVEPPSTPLSSSSTRASTDSTSTNDGTNGNSTARKYYCSTGALLAGHDVDVGLFPTVEAAEKHCNANSTCTAFTYRAPNSTAPPNAPLKVYFKSSLAFNGDAAWKLCWQSKTAAIRLRGKCTRTATSWSIRTVSPLLPSFFPFLSFLCWWFTCVLDVCCEDTCELSTSTIWCAGTAAH